MCMYMYVYNLYQCERGDSLGRNGSWVSSTFRRQRIDQGRVQRSLEGARQKFSKVSFIVLLSRVFTLWILLNTQVCASQNGAICSKASSIVFFHCKLSSGLTVEIFSLWIFSNAQARAKNAPYSQKPALKSFSIVYSVAV